MFGKTTKKKGEVSEFSLKDQDGWGLGGVKKNLDKKLHDK